MKDKTDVLNALREGKPMKAFDIAMDIITFYSTLEQWGLNMLTPHIPHKIWIYDEIIAYKTKDGVRAYLEIVLDWIRQELSIEVDNRIKETRPLPLE